MTVALEETLGGSSPEPALPSRSCLSLWFYQQQLSPRAGAVFPPREPLGLTRPQGPRFPAEFRLSLDLFGNEGIQGAALPGSF